MSIASGCLITRFRMMLRTIERGCVTWLLCEGGGRAWKTPPSSLLSGLRLFSKWELMYVA